MSTHPSTSNRLAIAAVVSVESILVLGLLVLGLISQGAAAV